MKQTLRALLVLGAAGLLSSCDTLRLNKMMITMHVQATDTEHPRGIMTLPIGDQKMTFKRIPEFSQRSIAGFEPFPAENGQGYGVLLQLDAKGTNALEVVSRMSQGQALLTLVKGIPVDMVELDRPITNGRFTIWRGLAKETIDEMDKHYPHIKYMKSSSRWMDMLPSGDQEKINARRDAKKAEAAEKAAIKAKESGVKPPPPVTKDIPLEGFKLPGT